MKEETSDKAYRRPRELSKSVFTLNTRITTVIKV